MAGRIASFYRIEARRVSSLRFGQGFTACPVMIQCRAESSINGNSWAAKQLTEAGEVLKAKVELPPLHVTDHVINTPTEPIKRLVNDILALNVIEINQLLSYLQTRLNITDESIRLGMMGGGGGGGGGGNAPAAAAPVVVEPVKEKTAFDIKLTVVDAKSKIKIIKEVRAITGLGLKEAKELVEKAPVMIKEGLKKEEAEQLKKVLLEAGAEVEIL